MQLPRQFPRAHITQSRKKLSRKRSASRQYVFCRSREIPFKIVSMFAGVSIEPGDGGGARREGAFWPRYTF